VFDLAKVRHVGGNMSTVQSVVSGIEMRRLHVCIKPLP